MIAIIAYISTAGVLSSYAMSVAKHKPWLMDWGNAIFFAPLTVANLTVEAYWAAAISFIFGVIGCASLLSAYFSKAQSPTLS